MRTWASAHTPAGKHTAQQTRRHRHNRHAGTGTCTCIHTHRHNRHAGTCTCTCIHTRRHTRPLMAAPPCPFQSLLRQCRAVGRGIGGQPRRAGAASRCDVHPYTAVRCVAAIHTAVPPSAAALASFGGLSQYSARFLLCLELPVIAVNKIHRIINLVRASCRCKPLRRFLYCEQQHAACVVEHIFDHRPDVGIATVVVRTRLQDDGLFDRARCATLCGDSRACVCLYQSVAPGRFVALVGACVVCQARCCERTCACGMVGGECRGRGRRCGTWHNCPTLASPPPFALISLWLLAAQTSTTTPPSPASGKRHFVTTALWFTLVGSCWGWWLEAVPVSL